MRSAEEMYLTGDVQSGSGRKMYLDPRFMLSSYKRFNEYWKMARIVEKLTCKWQKNENSTLKDTFICHDNGYIILDKCHF